MELREYSDPLKALNPILSCVEGYFMAEVAGYGHHKRTQLTVGFSKKCPARLAK